VVYVALQVLLCPANICGGADKVAKVQSKLEPKDLFFGIITLGIYTPHTANVYCQE